MRTIGLIGGMSWESTVEYYRVLNERVRERLGGHHSAKCVLVSVDFAEIEAYQQAGDWVAAGQVLVQAAQSLVAAGADCVLICANTMHKVVAAVEEVLDDVPLLHIAEATAVRIHEAGLQKIGLLGTEFTMTMDFYKGYLAEKHGLEVLVPSTAEREIIHRVIYEELCVGVIREESRAAYVDIMQNLVGRGAQGIILGCTEIPLLVGAGDAAVPLFDTTFIHADTAVAFALGQKGMGFC